VEIEKHVISGVGPAYPMLSRINAKSERVRRWSQGVWDWGYVIGDKPSPGIKNQTN